MMKLEPIKINITAAKNQFGSDLSVNTIKADLELEGALVRGYKEAGVVIMEISGDIEFEQIENVFEENGMYGIAEFVIDDLSDDEFDEEPVDEIIEEEIIEPVVEKKSYRFSKAVLEKFNGKFKKPVKSNKMVNLAEALGVTKPSQSKALSLDEVIDNMVGSRIDESIAKKAIAKIKSEKNAVLEQYRGKLGEQRFNRVLESLENGSQYLYGNVKVNGKAISEYTVNELKTLLEKLNGQISEIERKISLNEGDSKKLNEVLDQKKRLQVMLDDEISYRLAFDHKVNEDEEKKEDALDNFKDFNPEPLENEEEPKDEDAEESEDEQNPDEDEEEEVSKIIITLKHMEAAESLKNDLIEAGVPEDAIILEEIKDEEESEEETEEPAESEEESTEESEEAEKQEESVKVSGNKLNEEDGEESEEETDEDAESEEESEEDAEEVAVKLILTDTDYVAEMMEVLENEWGMTREEFEELIGGEIVTGEDEEDSEENEEGEESEESEEANQEDDEDDFNPDEIFKNL